MRLLNVARDTDACCSLSPGPSASTQGPVEFTLGGMILDGVQAGEFMLQVAAGRSPMPDPCAMHRSAEFIV